MIDHRLAEMCCDLLGLAWIERATVSAIMRSRRTDVAFVSPRGDGSFLMSFSENTDRRTYTVDHTALLIAALVRHAKSVDVGPCPKCGGSKRRPGRDYVDPLGPCPICHGDGKPTGRQIVSAPEAVLMAAHRDPSHCRSEHCYDDITCDMGWPDKRHCENLRGHDGARAALARRAATWREHLPVLADWAFSTGQIDAVVFGAWAAAEKSSGRVPSLAKWVERYDQRGFDCPHVPLTLAECCVSAAWLLAWLGDVECPCCEGSGDFSDDPDPGCRNCGSIGIVRTGENHLRTHMLRAHIAAAWERETVECPQCIVDRKRFQVLRPRVEACRRCAGLGRVRPTEVPA